MKKCPICSKPFDDEGFPTCSCDIEVDVSLFRPIRCPWNPSNEGAQDEDFRAEAEEEAIERFADETDDRDCGDK